MILIILSVLLFNSLQTNAPDVCVSPKLDIKIIAFKSEPIVKGQKERLAIFECKFTNNSDESFKNIYNRILIKENNQPAELFYITPVLNKDLISNRFIFGDFKK
jgi:hypothetical protein